MFIIYDSISASSLIRGSTQARIRSEIKTPTIVLDKVFETSGHVEKFTDLMIECEETTYRADHLAEEIAESKKDTINTDSMTDDEIIEYIISSDFFKGKKIEFKHKNLMHTVDNSNYLRPELAQNIVLNSVNR